MTSRQRKPRAKKIKHELFDECSKLEDSPYWQTIFQACAYGHFPQNMTFKNGILYYRKARRKQPITYMISPDPRQAILDLKDALQKEKNLISVDELTEKRIKAREKLAEITLDEDTKWSDISSSISKHLILLTYVAETKVALRLTDEEAVQLFSSIIVGIVTGIIGDDDIHMNRGHINEINKIKRYPNGFFVIGKSDMGKPKPPVPKVETQTNSTVGWDKFSSAYSKCIKQSAL